MTEVVVNTEAAADSRRLVNLLDSVLERVVTVFAEAGVALPERRYWTLTAPAVDCEQVVVNFIQSYIGPPGDEAALPQRCSAPTTASLQVQIHRCIPVMNARGKAPSAAAIQNGAEKLAVDLMILQSQACSFDAWEEVPGSGLGVIATGSAQPPQGEFQGVVLDLTLGIP